MATQYVSGIFITHDCSLDLKRNFTDFRRMPTAFAINSLHIAQTAKIPFLQKPTAGLKTQSVHSHWPLPLACVHISVCPKSSRQDKERREIQAPKKSKLLQIRVFRKSILKFPSSIGEPDFTASDDFNQRCWNIIPDITSNYSSSENSSQDRPLIPRGLRRSFQPQLIELVPLSTWCFTQSFAEPFDN